MTNENSSKWDVQKAESLMHTRAATPFGYLYIECGAGKPWNPSIVRALRNRGYRVDDKGNAVYYAYPKL